MVIQEKEARLLALSSGAGGRVGQEGDGDLALPLGITYKAIILPV